MADRSAILRWQISRDESQKWLAAIANATEETNIGEDLSGTVVYWNRAAATMFGYSDVEMIGRSIDVIVPPERCDEETVLLERIRRGERIVHHETERLRKDGARVSLALTVSPIRDARGTIIGASKIARPIGDAGGMRHDQRDSQDLLRVIHNAVPVALVTIDDQGMIRGFSEMAERMFGFRAAEVVGGDVSALLLPPGRERHPGSLRRYLKTRLPRLIGFSRVANARRKDGGKFTLRLTIGEVNLPTERLFTGVLQNLTEDVIDGRRRRESEAKPNEMASRLAHEVTQPLTAIASYIDGAMSLLRAGDPAGALRAMNRVVEQTERAGEIIRQLRAQAKKSDDPRPPVKAGTRVIREVLAHAR